MRKAIERILAGGRTKRFHTVPTVEGQNVGCHSYGVALMVHMLTSGRWSKDLMLYALLHDVPESVVGDVPAPTKRSSPGLKAAMDAMEEDVLLEAGFEGVELSEPELRTLKLADCLDGILACIYECRLGNRGIYQVYWNFRSYIIELQPKGREADILNVVSEMWREAYGVR